jgi:ubiquitin C
MSPVPFASAFSNPLIHTSAARERRMREDGDFWAGGRSEYAGKVESAMVSFLFAVATAAVIVWFILLCHGSRSMQDVTRGLGSVPLSRSFAIFIKKPDGQYIPMTVGPADRVEVLKFKIQQREGIPVDGQVLLFGDSKLSDGNSLHDYSIGVNSAVHLCYRRRE